VPIVCASYDVDITPHAFALEAVRNILSLGKPYIVNHRLMTKDFGPNYCIASCLNGMPIGGGRSHAASPHVTQQGGGGGIGHVHFAVKVKQWRTPLSCGVSPSLLYLHTHSVVHKSRMKNFWSPSTAARARGRSP